MIFIDQLSAIKNIINRPTFSLSKRQATMIYEKFRNMASTRQQHLKQNPVQELSSSLTKSQETPPPTHFGHPYETDNEPESAREDQRSPRVRVF